MPQELAAFEAAGHIKAEHASAQREVSRAQSRGQEKTPAAVGTTFQRSHHLLPALWCRNTQGQGVVGFEVCFRLLSLQRLTYCVRRAATAVEAREGNVNVVNASLIEASVLILIAPFNCNAKYPFVPRLVTFGILNYFPRSQITRHVSEVLLHASAVELTTCRASASAGDCSHRGAARATRAAREVHLPRDESCTRPRRKTTKRRPWRLEGRGVRMEVPLTLLSTPPSQHAQLATLVQTHTVDVVIFIRIVRKHLAEGLASCLDIWARWAACVVDAGRKACPSVALRMLVLLFGGRRTIRARHSSRSTRRTSSR
eukprot:6201300-Pleurochrysis_carterae.AAC.1